jgi:hypothetical protein
MFQQGSKTPKRDWVDLLFANPKQPTSFLFVFYKVLNVKEL